MTALADNGWNQALSCVGARVLSEWAMMMVDEIKAEMAMFDSTAKFFIATMGFKGDDRRLGDVLVLCQAPFMNALCHNLLGLDEGETVNAEDLEDAVRELVNVLTGNFLTEAFGDDTVFELFSPAVNGAPIAAATAFLQAEPICAFIADEQPVVLRLQL